LGNNPGLISSRKTNRPGHITNDWGGLIDFMPNGNIFSDNGLRLVFSLKNNPEVSFDDYVKNQVMSLNQVTSLNVDSEKDFSVDGKKTIRIRYIIQDQYGPSYQSWYFIEMQDKKVLLISTSGDKKLSYDNNADGMSTVDKIISTFKFIDQLQIVESTIKEKDFNFECTGENHPRYNLGFGVEHEYEGTIKEGQEVKIILSCDHKKLKISGAVNQVISSKFQLADLVSGSNVIGVKEDYNFDGYNDLESISSNGQGISALDSYEIFLYDSELNKFVFNEELSNIVNIYPEVSDQTIRQEFNFGYGIGFERIIYRWEGDKLIKITKEECRLVERSQDPVFYRYKVIDFLENGSAKIRLDETKAMGKESCLNPIF